MADLDPSAAGFLALFVALAAALAAARHHVEEGPESCERRNQGRGHRSHCSQQNRHGCPCGGWLGAVARTPLGTASCIKRAASRKKDHMGCLREMDAEHCGSQRQPRALLPYCVVQSWMQSPNADGAVLESSCNGSASARRGSNLQVVRFGQGHYACMLCGVLSSDGSCAAPLANGICNAECF